MTKIKKIFDTFGLGLILLLLCALFAFQSDDFLTAGNLSNVLRQASVNIIIAVGMTFVICAAEIDLSVGSLLALCGMMTALALRVDMETGHNLPMAAAGWLSGAEGGAVWWMAASLVFLAAAFLPGLVCGSAAGFLVVRFAVPSFIVTLGMMMIYKGFARYLTDAAPVFGMPMAFSQVGSGDLLVVADFRVSYAALIALTVAAAGHVTLNHTRFGRHVLSIGGNRQASYLSGVPVARTRFLVFALSGFFVSIAAIVQTSRLFIGDPNAGGGYELNAIAAVIIGGTSLFGGKGSVIGTVIGALIIGVLDNGLDFTEVSDHTKQMVIGAMIIFAVLLDYYRQRWQQR